MLYADKPSLTMMDKAKMPFVKVSFFILETKLMRLDNCKVKMFDCKQDKNTFYPALVKFLFHLSSALLPAVAIFVSVSVRG